KIIKHDLGTCTYCNKYKVIEEWSFDIQKGFTQIKIAKIVPIREIRDDNGKFRYYHDVYWLKFEDISGILAKYEQSHYNNSLASLLWKDYFLSDVKPSM